MGLGASFYGLWVWELALASNKAIVRICTEYSL